MITPTFETQKHNEHSSFSDSGLKNKRIILYIIIFLVLSVSLGTFYLYFAWNKYKEISSSEAIMLAQSLESFLHKEHVNALTGGAEDLEKTEYNLIKSNLIRLTELSNPIHFAYIFDERDGDIIILLDSEPSDSTAYSPPGQLYYEASDNHRELFQTGKTIITEKITDRWGSWISVLVPIKDPNSGNIIAALGTDYSAPEWQLNLLKQMIPDIIIVLCIFVLLVALLVIWRQKYILKSLNEKLAIEEALYHSVFDQAPIGIAIINGENFVSKFEIGDVSINPMFGKILGRDPIELQGQKWTEITHPDDLHLDLEKLKQLKEGQIDGYSIEKRFIRPDGSNVWTNMEVSYLSGLPYEHSMHLCLLEDISLRKETADALRESERSKSVLLSHLPGMAYRCNYDRVWTMQYVSEGCFELTGYNAESLLYNKELSFNDVIAPEYRDFLWKEWAYLLDHRLPLKQEYEIITARGERKWVLEMGQGIFNEQGDVEALEGIILDISDRKEIENNLRYRNDNPWTGLHNRWYLENLLREDAKAKTARKRAIIGINLSSIYRLSLSYGFHYSQELIKRTANALKRLCTSKHQLFHTYNNRFVFYFKDYEDKNELTSFCEVIISALESVFINDRIDGGIGIIEIDEDNRHDIEQLLRNVLIASEKALHNIDKNLSFCFFDKVMEDQIIREEEIKHELAIIETDENDGGLFVQYQPILDLKSNQICAFEALARLKSNKLGLVSPLEFIPIAEKTKSIIVLGEKIILKALDFINKLKENGHLGISVSINISAIQLLTKNFNNNLFNMMSRKRIDPANLCLEITETRFSENYQEINSILSEIKASGIHIAIDDFGKGYSSLARERELNINCLKIDKHFIDKLVSLEETEAITGDIVSMAHKLGHYVIAEGVEFEAQRQYLIKHECDKIQGYLISKPLDEEEAIDFLNTYNKK